MSLVRAELRRLTKRRITRYLLLLVVLGLTTIAVAFSLASQKIGPEQRAAAQAEADRQFQQVQAYHQQEVAACEAAKARGENVDRWGPNCGKDFGPQREQFEAEWYLPFQFNFRDYFSDTISVLCGILIMFAFIVGASYVGAEWNSGGMMNLLLWRPKRLTVLFTKLGVLLGALLVVSVVLGALWTAAFWLIAKYDGQTGDVTAGAWRSFALDGARGFGLVLATAVVAFGLASFGRHTAMALGAVLAVGVVVEIGLRTVLEIASVPFAGRYVLSTYVASWFEKKLTLEDYRSCEFTSGECLPAQFVITWQDSALVFGIGTAAVLALATLAMRRRDIT